MAGRLGTAYVDVAGNFGPIQKQMAAQAGPLGKGGSKLGKVMGAGIVAGAAAAGIGKALYDIGSQFDKATDKIRVGTGATGKDLKALQGDFKAVVSDVPTDFGSASTAIADLNTRLGLSGKPLRRLSKQMLELSRITDTDVNENVESVTRLFGDWSVKTGQQAKTLDKLFRVSQATGIGVSDLSRSMVQFGSPLRQLGFDFDRAAAMFAQFEKEGVNVQTLMPGLRFALKNLSGASPKLTEELKKLGVSLKDPSVALEQVFKLVKAAPSDLKANALAFKVFGQRAGPDMAAAIREGRFDLDKLLKTMRGGKDTIRGAADDTADLAERWQLFRNQLAVQLEPTATRVFQKVGAEAEKLMDILVDPKLTSDEKFSKVVDRLSRLFEQALPKLLDTAAKVGPKVASALARGLLSWWADANPLAKLLGTAAIIRLVGGKGAIAATGATIGRFLGGGIAAGATTTAVGGVGVGAAAGGLIGSMRSKLLPIAKRAGLIGVGLVLADGVMSEFGRRTAAKGPELFDALKAKAGVFEDPGAGNWLSRQFGAGGDEQAKKLADRLKDIAENAEAIDPSQAKALRQQLKALGGVSDEASSQFNQLINASVNKSKDLGLIKNEFGRLRSGAVADVKAMRSVTDDQMTRIGRSLGFHSKEGKEAVRRNFRGSADWIRKYMSDGKGLTEKGSKEMARLLRVHSRKGKEGLKGNMDDIIGVIARTMRRGGKITNEGLAMIRRAYVEQLKMYGLSPKQALNEAKPGTRYDAGPDEGTRGPGHARGGLVQFGQSGGAGRDTIPANIGGQNVAVGSGEVAAVFNRHQLPVLNARLSDMGGLPGLFKRHDRPHYMARGGYVQGASPPSGSGSGPIRALAEQLFKRGFSVTSGGEYRGSGTYHDQQRALDFGDSVNSMPGLWKALFPKRGQTAELFGPSALPGGGLYKNGGKFSDSGLQAMHEDHIHVALLSALSGALGKGGAAVAAKLRRVLVRGPDSPLKSVVQGSLDAAHNAAQQRLSQIVERSGAGTGQALDIGAGGNYQGPLDRNFGENSSTTIGFNQAAMLAEKAGLPGVTYAQIAQGESGLRPGAVSPDGGYGLWQMTPRVQSGATVSAWESIGSYFNPWNNARMAKVLAGSGTGVSNYYGTGFVTDYNKHYTGPMNFARGGMLEMFAPGGLVGRPAGRMPSRADVTGQARETEQARDRLQKLRQQEDPRKKKALEKLEKARAAAKKDYGAQKGKLKAMRQQRKAGKGRQGRRQTRLSGLLAGMGLPENLIGLLDSRGVELEDAEALYGQAEGSYRAEERITPETLRSLLGPGMGGLTADDQKDLIGSTQSILTPPELNDLLGRQQGLLTGYEHQQGLAARIRDTIQERIPKLEGLLTKLRDRAKSNMDELRRRLTEAKRLRSEMEDKSKRLRTTTADVREIRNKKKPTDADQKRLVRLGKEAEAIRERIPNIASRLTEIGARVPVLEGDNSFLTGQRRPRSFSGEGVEGLIGKGQTVLGENLKGRLPDFAEMLRPGGIPSQIHETGLAISGLKLEGAWSPERSDPAGSADAGEDESAGLLRELLQQANQRTAVSERGFEVLRNFPAFGGSFGTGGVVPGPAGASRIIEAHGGETVLTEAQSATVGSEVKVVLEDHRTTVLQDDKVIRSIVHDETRKQSRGAIRGLPSGGGGRY